MQDKLGPYITKLMTTVIDKDLDDFVKQLALSELQRLGQDVNDFIEKHSASFTSVGTNWFYRTMKNSQPH